MKEIMQAYGMQLLNSLGEHLFYIAVSVSLGFVLGLLMGVLLSRIPKWSFVILPVLSVFQTIPGLVFIGILFLIMGITPWTVIIALTVYAVFPVMKNTYTGITGVARAYVEAAKGCGMNPLQCLMRVEIPLAMPSIITGLKMSAVYTVSWAVLAAVIGLGGLGEFVYQGIQSNNNTLILLGAVPASLLAIAISLLIDLLQKKLDPLKHKKAVGK